MIKSEITKFATYYLKISFDKFFKTENNIFNKKMFVLRYKQYSMTYLLSII